MASSRDGASLGFDRGVGAPVWRNLHGSGLQVWMDLLAEVCGGCTLNARFIPFSLWVAPSMLIVIRAPTRVQGSQAV